MRDEKRINRILNLLEKLWSKHPDSRFGQLLINLNIVNDDLRLWNAEDKDLEEYLKELIKHEK